MPTVYRVGLNVDDYQSVLESGDGGFPIRNRFDGRPIGSAWNPPECYIQNPKLKRPDFWSCFAVWFWFAVTKECAHKIVTFLDQSCETLPLPVEDSGELLFCNVTEVVNCLDKKQSEAKPYPGTYKKYVFHPDRWNFSLFKIPETAPWEVLCVEGVTDPNDEFKGTVERLGLTGIKFQKLWSDES